MRFAPLTAISFAVLALLLLPASCGASGEAASEGDSGSGSPGSSESGTQQTPPDGSKPVVDSATSDATTSKTCTGKTGARGDRTVTITSGGKERSFDLHVPAKYDPAKGAPLVFVFHGYTMSAASIASATHFAEVADKRGLIVAFPSGLGGGFNAGDCCGTAASSKVDDVGFTRDMISKLNAEYCVDPKRVFSTGLSNGGFFSYTLACEMADTIAAIAPVAGVLGVEPAACSPKRPVPVLHIHGTSDIVVPYAGGGISNFRSVAVTIDAFKAKNACAAGDGKVVYTKNDVSCTKWDGCTADVELCTVTGGGHQWPGGSLLPYGGSPTPNLIASEAIADFFEAHPLP